MFLLVFVSFCLARTVDFAWEPFSNARAYQIQIATDMNFKQIQHKKLTKAPSYSLDLNYGQYYYRVRAIDENKRPGVWSETEIVVVKPYIPDLKEPTADHVVKRFAKDVKVNFKWNNAKDIPESNIIIRKETGEVVVDEKVRGNSFSWLPTEEGRYYWKVNAIYDEDNFSDYSGERRLDIQRRDLSAPLAIRPTDKKFFAAYREIRFEWEIFPPSKLSHVEIEGPQNFQVSDLQKSEYNLEGLAPGSYRWRVASSEDENSPKKYSEWHKIEVSEEVLSNRDYYIGMKLGYLQSETKYRTDRATSSSTAYSDEDSLFFTSWYANIQMSETSSFFIETDRATYNYDQTFKKSGFDISYQARIGVPNFQKVFFIGLRQSQYMELWQEAGGLGANYINARGPILGMKMFGRIARDYRLHLDFTYHAVDSSIQKVGKIDGEVYEFRLGLSKKLWHKIWWKAEAGFNKELLEFSTESQGTTSWNTEELIPLSIGLEYRH